MTPAVLLRDREITPEQLLQSFKPAGALPPIDHRDELVFWLRTVEHNCKVIIRFCQLELEKDLGADHELLATLRNTKKQATEALLSTEEILRRKGLSNGRRLKLLREKYDNLRASIGSIFLLIAPDYLALRAERAL